MLLSYFIPEGSIFMDERLKTLAHNLIHYSCRVKPGEKVYIE